MDDRDHLSDAFLRFVLFGAAAPCAAWVLTVYLITLLVGVDLVEKTDSG